MSIDDPWLSKGSGPWPLLTAADGESAAHCQNLDKGRTWFAREGIPMALPPVCPHRGMPLAGCRIENGLAVCPYHGMRLAPVEDEPMFRFKGFDWTGQRNAGVDYLAAQSESQPWMREVFRICGHTSAPLVLSLENFLDATHTAHVHPGMVRREGHEKWIKARGATHPWGFEIEYMEEAKQSGWLGRLTEPPRLTSFGRYIHPFAAQVDYVGLDRKTYFRATAYMNPTSSGTEVMAIVESRLWRMGLGPLLPMRWLTKNLFGKVLQQDIGVLERAWQGITDQGLSPSDLQCRSQDLAWPWLLKWMDPSPPAAGQVFEGAVKA